MQIHGDAAMQQFGEKLGAQLRGGEVFELIGDVGAGKTTFTRGLAKGLGVSEQVQSPTFTISREYDGRDNLTLVHYDFYRLNEAGIMAEELAETVANRQNVTVIEWSGVASDSLPRERVVLRILPVAEDENAREVQISGEGEFATEVAHVFTA